MRCLINTIHTNLDPHYAEWCFRAKKIVLNYGQNILFTLICQKCRYQKGLDISKSLLLIDYYLALKLTRNDLIISLLIAILVLLNITKITLVN